jgi:hypothetical protein
LERLALKLNKIKRDSDSEKYKVRILSPFDVNNYFNKLSAKINYFTAAGSLLFPFRMDFFQEEAPVAAVGDVVVSSFLIAI